MKSKSILPLAILMAVSASFSAQAETGYAEALYADYAKAAQDTISFNVVSLAELSPKGLEKYTFQHYVGYPSYEIVADVNGNKFENIHFKEVSSKAATDEIFEAFHSFDKAGLPLHDANIRVLDINVSLHGKSQNHRALELCWAKIGHCVIYDPAVVYVDSYVQNIRRMKAEGWIEREFYGDSASRATSCVMANSSSSTYSVSKPAFNFILKNALGYVQLNKSIDTVDVTMICGYSSSKCTMNIDEDVQGSNAFDTVSTWNTQCDDNYSEYKSTSGTSITGRFAAATGCTHSKTNGAYLSYNIFQPNTLGVELKADYGGSIHQNKTTVQRTCQIK